jgi:hypothetical protein
MSIKSNFLYFSGRFLRLFLITLVVVFFVILLSFGLSWRSWLKFSQSALNGKNQLSAALSQLKAREWQEAESTLQAAEASFKSGEEALESLRSSWLPAKIGFGSKQLNDLEYLNASALIITRSAIQGSKLAQGLNLDDIKDGNFNNLSPERKAAFLQSLIALEPELNGLKANLNLALLNLNHIQRFGILWPLRGQLQEVKEQLATGEELLTESLPILRLLPAFSGYPETARYLIMLQNNDELRPTGGFLGSYVRADIKNFGEIENLKSDDVYHLDMPAIGKTQYQAPTPISKYLKVENWYLRDANWSPDWPQSARQIQEMFIAESSAGGQEVPPLDGILAITPDFVANLLKITGPITVRGESYAPENMQALLQYNVEVAYKDDDISSWDRKDIINELINALKDKLMALPLNQYPQLIARLNESLGRGDLLLYFNNPERQAIALDLGGAGELKNVSGDYLMVVDANLAAFKSDAVMKKNISYHLLTEQQGLKAELRLNYQHTGGFDWRTTRYRSYTRVLAPLGSELIDIKGVDRAASDFVSYDDNTLGKHVFGFFWSIEPGQNGEINLSYKLPSRLYENLDANKVYTLFVQRQPGSRIEALSINLEPGKEIIQVSPQNLEGEIKKNGAYWTLKLEKNQALQLLTK